MQHLVFCMKQFKNKYVKYNDCELAYHSHKSSPRRQALQA